MRSFGIVFFLVIFSASQQPTFAQQFSEDPCSPNNAGYHVNQVTAMLTRQQCDTQRQQQEQAAEAQRQQDAQQQVYQQQMATAASERERAENAAAARGYKRVRRVMDLILDGKQLARENAKIQVSGIYRKIGDGELLFASEGDALESTDKYISLLTDDAQRDLREYLLSNSCAWQVGCKVDIGGHMVWCHNILSVVSDAPSEPCLKVEVEIVYRPGD